MHNLDDDKQMEVQCTFLPNLSRKEDSVASIIIGAGVAITLSVNRDGHIAIFKTMGRNSF